MKCKISFQVFPFLTTFFIFYLKIPSSDNDFDDDAKNHEPANKDAGADHDPLDKDGENHERGFCESKVSKIRNLS